MNRRAGGLLLCVCCGLACTSTVWYGRSPDRRHLVEVIARGQEQRVRRDSRLDPAFEAIGVESLSFDPDGRRVAYPARRGDRWMLVVDGVPGRPWDGIGEVRFSPDGRRVAYGALEGTRWQVVCDGRVGPVADAVLAGSLTFTLDGRHLAHVIARGEEHRVVMDGRLGPAYRAIGQLAFEGDRLRYVARGARGVHLVVDEREGPPFSAITQVAWSPEGRRRAYLARTASGAVAVVDGKPGPPHDGAAGLLFSRDGRHVAYAAQCGARARVMIDGVEGPLFDGVRVQTLAFTGRGALLYVAHERGWYRVVHDGTAGPPFEEIDRPAVGPRVNRWGYVARRGRRYEVVVDGMTVGEYDWAGDLTFGPDGAQRYVVARGGQRAVVHQGHQHPLDVVVEGTLVVSRDGRHWACLAGDRHRRELFVSVDGAERRPFDLQELVGAVAHGSGRAELLRQWISAELEAATSGSRPSDKKGSTTLR